MGRAGDAGEVSLISLVELHIGDTGGELELSKMVMRLMEVEFGLMFTFCWSNCWFYYYTGRFD